MRPALLCARTLGRRAKSHSTPALLRPQRRFPGRAVVRVCYRKTALYNKLLAVHESPPDSSYVTDSAQPIAAGAVGSVHCPTCFLPSAPCPWNRPCLAPARFRENFSRAHSERPESSKLGGMSEFAQRHPTPVARRRRPSRGDGARHTSMRRERSVPGAASSVPSHEHRSMSDRAICISGVGSALEILRAVSYKKVRRLTSCVVVAFPRSYHNSSLGCVL